MQLAPTQVLSVTPAFAKGLAVLDDPQEWGAFSRALEGRNGMWESSVVIEGMHCAACSLTVEDALLQIPGVVSAQVSSASHRAKVVWVQSQVLPSVWLAAVAAAGYRALPANDIFASEHRRVETRQALWRWLVAGLCMMQVMMYAYPAYIAQPGDLTAEMERLLRWASWVLTLPVMLFSSGPFFKAALRDLSRGRISMDLPVALGIAITFAVSSVGTFTPEGIFGREVYFDSLTMFVFFLLTGRWLELRLRDRTAGALEALMNRLPDSVERKLADGSFVRVAARRITVGDVVRVHPGETFPADGLITVGTTSVDEALMTGESRPIARAAGMPVLCGSHNLSGTVIVRVDCVGTSTRFAQIVALMDSAASSKPHSAQIADRLAKPFLVGVLVAAALACAWWWERDPGHALMVAVAVLIVTCPCALSLATPAAMLASAGAMAKTGVLVRRLQALETLAGVTTVVFDKTGTLTSDAMVLGQTTALGGLSAGDVLQMAQALAQHSLHPVSRALVQARSPHGAAADPSWSCATATELPGQGVQGEVVCSGPGGAMLQLRLGSAAFCGVPASAVLPSQVFLADAQGWVATFDLEECLRPQAAGAVTMLQAQGLAVHMLSGDSVLAATDVARRAGIVQVRGACSPQDKLEFLKALQASGQVVAMVGDGLNDGPVLAGADVSIAFGKAVPLAQARADFVILGDDLTLVAGTVLRAQRTLRVVRQNLWWAVAYNAACVPLAVAGYLPAWLAGLGMAASSLLVVLNAMRLAWPEPLEAPA
ncbi:MAG: copper-translocating P-type ATPase [Burkholderiales bacterium PBB3]|nr:MAG: copper-translocating P-type ATPase [Burkholderiales bacterium PBB3]